MKFTILKKNGEKPSQFQSLSESQAHHPVSLYLNSPATVKSESGTAQVLKTQTNVCHSYNGLQSAVVSFEED